MADNLVYSRLGGSAANFQGMIQRFGIVTVMNARVYESLTAEEFAGKDAVEILKTLGSASGSTWTWNTPLCRLDTLKIANATQDGPTKTVSGGQFSNPLIKFGKSMRLEMQDALGSAQALDALGGTVAEGSTAGANGVDYGSVHALHITEDFNGPKLIVGDTFFIDQVSGQQVPALIVFYQFLPDSIFNLAQDAEGDATVFDMNGDCLTTVITVGDRNGDPIEHGVFYSIVDPKDLLA